jgi:hypothetical protein
MEPTRPNGPAGTTDPRPANGRRMALAALLCAMAAMGEAAGPGGGGYGREEMTPTDSGAELKFDGALAGIERASLQALDVATVSGEAPAGCRLEVRDGAGRAYHARDVAGEFSLDLPAGGRLGRQQVVLLGPEGPELARLALDVDAHTQVTCSPNTYAEVWDAFEAFVRRFGRKRNLGGKDVTIYVPWVRDDTHVMKAFKYWEPEVGSFQEHMLDVQTDEGIIYDYVMRVEDDAFQGRLAVFDPRYCRVEPGERYGYQRLPVEADLEYLLVEGTYTAWQARGDDDWMARQLPRLEKGLRYMMTDPLRWSPEHGLVKRGYTIDTWDFKFFGFDRRHLQTNEQVQEAVFNTHPDTPMCIMHGDNSGMYQACRQMSRMFAALGDEEKNEHYDRLAAQFRENTNRHCWNGRYYDHWVPVTPLEMDQGGIDGSKVLSLSNPYDINRGLPDQEQAAGIIREYQRIREETRDRYIAEWFSVYPWWPKGFSGIEPAEYVNGGIIIIVAGELAKAALQHGFEEYGADIIARIQTLMQQEWPQPEGSRRERRSPMPCTFRPTGEVSYGIPDNWAQAAVMSAIMEGLCGLRDESKLFTDAAVEPRWTAAGVAEASVTARYGASDGYVAYRFRHDEESQRIALTATGSGDRLAFHVLLPMGASAASVTCDGRPAEFESTQVGNSRYVDFTLRGPVCAEIEIAYAAGR